MKTLTVAVCFYSVVGLVVGVLVNLAGRWLLQRRARQQNSHPLHLASVPVHPFTAGPLPRWLAIVTGVGFGALWLRYGPSAQTVIISAYFSVFVLIFALDVAHRWVPNALLLPMAILVLGVSAVTEQPPLSSTLVGGIVGFVWFYLVAIAYRGALGAGDVKLAGLIGLMTGFPNVIIALTLGILVGGVGATVLLIWGRKTRKSYMPYAPFLVTGALCTLLFGTELIAQLSSVSGW